MSAASEIKDDRKYTKDHEWARVDGDEIIVGISAFAVSQLGDVTLVGIDLKPGDNVEAKKTFGTIESVKTLSDLYAPVSGTITRVNAALEKAPELVNEDPWDKGWMIAIRPTRLAEEQAALLDAKSYKQHLDAADH